MRQRAILFVGGALLVAVVTLVFVVQPVYEDNQTIMTRLDHARQELATSQVEIENTRRLVADFNTVSATQRASLNKRFPIDANEESLIVQLEAMAVTNQVILGTIQLTPEETSNGRNFRELFIDLGVAGSYESLKGLLSDLAFNDRLLTIDSISFTPGELGLEGVITLRAYFSAVDVQANATAPLNNGASQDGLLQQGSDEQTPPPATSNSVEEPASPSSSPDTSALDELITQPNI